MSAPSIGQMNIQRVLGIDSILGGAETAPYIDANGDFVDEAGFFIRAETEGYITYCPINNKTDAEAITKLFEVSYNFVDPEVCRKIFAAVTPQISPPMDMAEGIYVGWGV